MSTFNKLSFYISIIAGIILSIGDLMMQMHTMNANVFVQHVIECSYEKITFSSVIAVFLFPLWIQGIHFLYKTIDNKTKKYGSVILILMSYSTLQLTIFHYLYVVIYKLNTIGVVFSFSQWQAVIDSTLPFQICMFIVLPLSWIAWGILIYMRKVYIPRWSLLINPVVVSLLLFILSFTKVQFINWLLPGIFSLTITGNIFVAYIYFKKRTWKES